MWVDPFLPASESVARDCGIAAPGDAAEFAVARLGFSPDAKQALVLRSTAKRGILNCSRQWGKSSVVAAKAVHRAYTEKDSLVLVVSPTLRQSAEFLRKAAGMLGRLEVRARGDGDNPISLLLPNGSRIVGLPGTERTVRGFSAASLLLVDEAAAVRDEMFHAMMPVLAVRDGGLWAMSTPRGRTGFFYELWEYGGPNWEKVSVPATQCPRIRPEFLEEQRSLMTQDVFDREYMCRFVDSRAMVFSREAVERAVDVGVTPLIFPDVWAR